LGLNGIFSTNRLYRAFEKYVAVKNVTGNEVAHFGTLHVRLKVRCRAPLKIDFTE